MAATSRAERDPRRIYFARAIDDQVPDAIDTARLLIVSELAHANVVLVDPYSEIEDALRAQHHTRARNEVDELIVESDLRLLKTCDAVFMDMSIPGRNYVGCSCELVYAHFWDIPVVVYVGQSGNDERVWLRHLAHSVWRDRAEAIAGLLTVAAGYDAGDKR
jgi:nucleoside 2-deoxyribosyltransferase